MSLSQFLRPTPSTGHNRIDGATLESAIAKSTGLIQKKTQNSNASSCGCGDNVPGLDWALAARNQIGHIATKYDAVEFRAPLPELFEAEVPFMVAETAMRYAEPVETVNHRATFIQRRQGIRREKVAVHDSNRFCRCCPNFLEQRREGRKILNVVDVVD